MAGRIKKGGYKGGRGYNGWHKTWNNKDVYLRSKLEFIYASYLDLNKKDYTLEDKVFLIDDKSYKPDFFIMEDDKLRVVEIKDSRQEKEEYLKNFKSYFDNKEIIYEVLSYKDMMKIKRNNNICVENWIDYCVSKNSNIDMRGKNNPHYGVKHSKEQKRVIGDKTRERFSTNESRLLHGKTIKESISDEIRQKISQKRIEVSKKKYPLINKECVICGKTFQVKKNTKREYRQTCSRKCEFILNEDKHSFATAEKLKHRYPIKLIKQGLVIVNHFGDILEENWDAKALEAKACNIISKNLGISIKSINKYFNNFNEYYEEIINESKNQKNN